MMASVTLAAAESLTSTGGNEAGGIHADNRGTGNAIIVLPGISMSSTKAGVDTTHMACSLMPVTRRYQPAGAGNASVTYNSGTINVSAVRPRGILAWIDGIGSARVTTEAGTTINVGGTQFGGPGFISFRATRLPRRTH